MKKIIAFFLISFLLFGAAGCDDDELSNPFLGTWEMEKSYIGYDTDDERIYNTIGADEVIVYFQKDGFFKVRSKSKMFVDEYFIPSGNYAYSYTTDTLYLNTGNEYFTKWKYIVENNNLSIILYRKMSMFAYPGPSIVYIFRKR